MAERIDKYYMILESIIQEYINDPGPISSEQLKGVLGIKISSATIRNYFKKMVESGELVQLHISSGRVPAAQTLKEYWSRRLPGLGRITVVNRKKLKEATKRFGIFCSLKPAAHNRLRKLVGVEDSYLILVFENYEIAVKYSQPLERFLKEFIDIEMTDLWHIANQVGARELGSRIEGALKSAKTVTEGTSELIDMANKSSHWCEKYLVRMIEGEIIEELESGLYFRDVVPEGYMAVRGDAIFGEEETKMLCVGHLSRNFENFFNSLGKE